MRLGSDLEPSWGRLGAILGPSWALLGLLGAVLEPLGALLEPSGGHLERLKAQSDELMKTYSNIGFLQGLRAPRESKLGQVGVQMPS